MSLKSLHEKLNATSKGKSVADALGGKVGNLQAMLLTIRQAPAGKESLTLQTIFGIDPALADEVVSLLVQRRERSENCEGDSLRKHLTEKGHEKGIERPARGQGPSRALSKVIKKAASIADRMTEGDREDGMEVLRAALHATTPYFNMETKRTEERIDLKTRLAALMLMLSYDEGLPVQRVMMAKVEVETADETLARLRESPEALRAIAGLRAAGVTLKIGEEIIDVESEVLQVAKREERH
jgi:hypothetical protein